MSVIIFPIQAVNPSCMNYVLPIGDVIVLRLTPFDSVLLLLQVKVQQGWQAIGTVGSEEAGSGASVVSCSDFRIAKPTLLLMGMFLFVFCGAVSIQRASRSGYLHALLST